MSIFESKGKKDKQQSDALADEKQADQGDGVAQGRLAAREKNQAPEHDALSGAAPMREGATTTTTTDSLTNQGGVETQSAGELDNRSPEERIEQLRGWKKKIGPRQPQSADWEDFDQIVGTGNIADSRRPT